MSELYIVHTVHFYSITHFLNQQNEQFLFIIQYNFYSKISPCFGSLFWDHHQGPIRYILKHFTY
jgi:hypothetical protein